MQHTWINKEEQNERLILFFNGWGQDELCVSHLKNEGYDVLMLNNYQHLSLEIPQHKTYKSIDLIAWSLGVWVAHQIMQDAPFTLRSAIAINGTINPISDEEGIASMIFAKTLDGWNERNRDRFNARMVGGQRNYLQTKDRFVKRSIEEQILELSFLNKAILKGKSEKPLSTVFTKAIIGSEDLIMTTNNQKNFWQRSNAEILEIEMPHYPFASFSDWKEIVETNTEVNSTEQTRTSL